MKTFFPIRSDPFWHILSKGQLIDFFSRITCGQKFRDINGCSYNESNSKLIFGPFVTALPLAMYNIKCHLQ